MRKWITGGCSLLLLGCVGGSVANGAPQGSWGARADVLIGEHGGRRLPGKQEPPGHWPLAAPSARDRVSNRPTPTITWTVCWLCNPPMEAWTPYSFDSWGDGRVTPVGAAHTISMYQAGLALCCLRGRRARCRGALDRMVTKLASMPFVTVSQEVHVLLGSPLRLHYGYCANNVAAAADLLFRAHQAGWVDPRGRCCVHPVRGGSANRTWRNWTYSNASSRLRTGTGSDDQALMSVAPGIADNFVNTTCRSPAVIGVAYAQLADSSQLCSR